MTEKEAPGVSTLELIDTLREALPGVGESESVWCTVQGHVLRAAIDRLAAALPQPPGSPPPLPKPARPARYYCNKCGAYPESDVHMAFRPTLSKRCHYLAAEIDPATYTADQMREYAAQAVASLPASSIAPPKSDVHLVGSQGHVLDAAS
jgi:hypothetical protein